MQVELLRKSNEKYQWTLDEKSWRCVEAVGDVGVCEDGGVNLGA